MGNPDVFLHWSSDCCRFVLALTCTWGPEVMQTFMG